MKSRFNSRVCIFSQLITVLLLYKICVFFCNPIYQSRLLQKDFIPCYHKDVLQSFWKKKKKFFFGITFKTEDRHLGLCYKFCKTPGEDSWRSLGLQGDQTNQFYRKSTLNIHWKDWCWSWSSNTLATWCKELTHWKRPWCWERLKTKGEGWQSMRWLDSTLTQWTWIWANSRTVEDWGDWCAIVDEVAKNWTWLHD